MVLPLIETGRPGGENDEFSFGHAKLDIQVEISDRQME